VKVAWAVASESSREVSDIKDLIGGFDQVRISVDSGLIFFFAGSVLVCTREQLLLSP
jgi:hypothetical protein